MKIKVSFFWGAIIIALIIGFMLGFFIATESISSAVYKVLEQYGYSPDILIKACLHKQGL